MYLSVHIVHKDLLHNHHYQDMFIKHLQKQIHINAQNVLHHSEINVHYENVVHEDEGNQDDEFGEDEHVDEDDEDVKDDNCDKIGVDHFLADHSPVNFFLQCSQT